MIWNFKNRAFEWGSEQIHHHLQTYLVLCVQHLLCIYSHHPSIQEYKLGLIPRKILNWYTYDKFILNYSFDHEKSQTGTSMTDLPQTTKNSKLVHMRQIYSLLVSIKLG